MKRMLMAATIAALIASMATALANYYYRDGTGALQQFFSFVCQGTTVCPGQVLIDSSGNEKGTSANPIVTSAVSSPTTSAGAFSGSTLGTSSAQVIAAGGAKIYAEIQNLCGTPGGCSAYVVCHWGAIPSNPPANGDVVLFPGQIFTWENSFVPADALNCLATSPSTPFTFAAK